MNRAVIGFGSNIEPDENIGRALEALSSISSVRKISAIRETAPLGGAGGSAYKNGALVLETNEEFSVFQSRLKAIEDSLGRREVQMASNRITIDLDLLIWNGEVLRNEVFERPFVSQAIHEIGEKIRQAMAK